MFIHKPLHILFIDLFFGADLYKFNTERESVTVNIRALYIQLYS
jgi:hypothetical protein